MPCEMTDQYLAIDAGFPRVQTEGEQVRWHFPEVPHIAFVDHVVRRRVHLDRKGVGTKQLVLDGLAGRPSQCLRVRRGV
jgi:hypothetical protein